MPRGRTILWLAVLAGLAASVFAFEDFRVLLGEAAGKVSLAAVVATLPGQVVAMLLCGAALWALRPGVGFWGCLGSRLLRDAGDNLPFIVPGLGDAIGARALVLAGGQTRAAITAGALDRVTETLAQVPYIAFAAFVLIGAWQAGEAGFAWPAPVTVMAIAAAAILFIIAFRWFLRVQGGPLYGLAERVRTEFRLLREEYHAQKAGIPASTALHFVAWIMGGVQIWMAAQALGFETSLYEAIAIESAAYAGRTILIFVPAGIGAQEAGLVAAGLVFGMSPAQSLALGLVLRLRDLVFGLPLLAWPLYELRHTRKAGRA